MSAESRAGLGVLVFLALVLTLIIDTFPRKYRNPLLIAMFVLGSAGWAWLCL